MKLLSNSSIKQLENLGSTDVIELRANDSLYHAMTVLSTYKILSAPVRDKQSNLVGMVDLMDIVALLGKLFTKENPKNIQSLSNYYREVSGLSLYTVKDLMNKSGRNPLKLLRENESITTAIQMFTKQPHPFHHIPIVNKQNQVVKIITQYDIIQYLFNNMNRFDSSVLRSTIKQLKHGNQSPVEYVTIHDTALKAFLRMHEKGVSALAVVNDNGILVGNISSTDIQGILSKNANILNELLLPVMQYLGDIRNPYSNLSASKVSGDDTRFMARSPVCAELNDTVGNVIETLVKERIHRIYVVDSSTKPLDVITLTDLIRGLKTQLPPAKM